MIIYADFTSAYCYLASLRVDRLPADDRGPIDWRTVEHRPGLPVPGLRLSSRAQVVRGRSLAAARSLLALREPFEARSPRFLPHTRSANTAYAAARAHGVGHEVRRTLFDAYWVQGLDIGRHDVVQRLLPAGLTSGRERTETTQQWQTEWLELGTCVDLTLVCEHHVECGAPALHLLGGRPLRVA